MSLQKPALDPMSLEPRTSSGYPEPYRSRVLPREKRALVLLLEQLRAGQTVNHTLRIDQILPNTLNRRFHLEAFLQS